MRKGRKGGDGKCPGLKGDATASRPALPGLSVLARLPRSSHTHRLPATAARPHLALPHLSLPHYSQVVAAPLGSPPGLPHPGLHPLGPRATPAADIPRVPRAVSQRPREQHGHQGSRGLCCEARLPGLRPGAVPGLCRGLCHSELGMGRSRQDCGQGDSRGYGKWRCPESSIWRRNFPCRDSRAWLTGQQWWTPGHNLPAAPPGLLSGPQQAKRAASRPCIWKT